MMFFDCVKHAFFPVMLSERSIMYSPIFRSNIAKVASKKFCEPPHPGKKTESQHPSRRKHASCESLKALGWIEIRKAVISKFDVLTSEFPQIFGSCMRTSE